MSIESITSIVKFSLVLLEIAVALLGIFYYNRFKNSPIRYFIFVLWITAVTEIIGLVFWQIFNEPNLIVFNVYHLLNFSITLFLFYKVLKNKVFKRNVKFLLYTFIAIYFCFMLIQNYLEEIITIPFIAGSIFIIIAIIYYFLEILNSEEVLFAQRTVLFWISTGLLVYFVGKIPMRIILNQWAEFGSFSHISLVQILLSIVMNSFFIFGFLWSEKQYQS